MIKVTNLVSPLYILGGDMAEWERELQAELQDFEVVAGDTQGVDDDDLERELLQQIEEEAQQ